MNGLLSKLGEKVNKDSDRKDLLQNQLVKNMDKINEAQTTSHFEEVGILAEKLGDKLNFLKQPKGFSTKAIHFGQDPDQWNSRAVIPPIVTSSTYSQMGPGEHHGYQYSTYKNPTRNSLEQCLASLDNAKYSIAFCAGGSALTSIMTLFEMGDNIISSKKFYAGDFEIWKFFGKLGIETRYVDFNNIKSLEESLDENTKMVWIESPTNPLMTILDIKLIADIVHSKSSAFLVVDNTFLTPYFQRPLELGADVVSYSVSKFISGHSDVIGGAISTNNDQLYEKIKDSQMCTGVAASPFNCYLINRSLRTLSVRMERHFENSYILTKFLEMHPKIAKVNHPALTSHKGHEIAVKQSYGHSGIFSFYLKDDSIEQSRTFLKSLRLIIVGESLGGTETMASLPWLMSHVSMNDEDKIKVGITQGLIRITVGLEDVQDLLEDIQSALQKLNSEFLIDKLTAAA